MLNGVCQFAYEAKWALDSFYYHTGILPPSWSGDGILCMLEIPETPSPLTPFIRSHAHIPTVDLSLNEPSVAVPRVLQDNVAMGKMGAAHLASIGCEQVGFVLQTRNNFHQERYEGFRKQAESLGLKVKLIKVPNNFKTWQHSPEWLARHVPPDARPFGIMAAADYIAQWVTKACITARLSIPGDVSILGVDNNFEICELAPISISSIDNNTFRHGYEGAKLLHRLMLGRAPPGEPVIVPPGALYVRETTSVMATRHPHVATALRHIAQHFAEPDLTPDHVAALVPMSKRRLNDAFIKYTGRSVYQELTHRRLQHALQLIQKTDRKLWDISESAGFNSPEVMSRLFHRKLGHWPSSYRQPG
jgi:LacI family transcriptional regulator